MNFSSPQDKEQYVHSTFQRIAGYYDMMNKIISFNQDQKWRRKAAAKTAGCPGQLILDCACGTGTLTCMLRPLVGEEGKVVGIDFSSEMLALAEEKCPRAEYVEGSILDLPFPDNTFHAAIMGFALRNLVDQNKAIQEMVRVVKPGGRVVILELNRPTIPVFKQAFGLYFNYLVPLLGKLLKGSANPYLYLSQSYSFLPVPEKLLQVMEQSGLTNTQMEQMTAGVTAVFWGIKKQ